MTPTEEPRGHPSQAESRPERPAPERVPDAPPTAHPDPAEPAGEEDPGNEARIEEATERPPEFGGDAASAAGAESVAPAGEGAAPGTASVAPGGEGAAPGTASVAPGGEGAAPGGEPPAPGGQTAVAEAEPGDPLEQARRERDFYLSLAQRAQADFDNYRKRSARDVAAAGERAKGALVRELLPVVDNLERALASALEGESHLAEGVRLVHAELVAALERNGVEQFDPRGDRFDPVVHDALSVRSEDGAQAGVVLDVVEKGYKVNGTVLRPARVVVSG